jgi:hypothetical protein
MNSRDMVELDHKHNGERLLRMLQKQHPNYHPLLSIAKIAHDAEVGYDQGDGVDVPNLELALRAHQTVLRFVEPELKSIEVKVEKKDTRTINVRLFEENVITVEDTSGQASNALDDGRTAERNLLTSVVNGIIEAEVVGE